jgi:hypothetical protein
LAGQAVRSELVTGEFPVIQEKFAQIGCTRPIPSPQSIDIPRLLVPFPYAMEQGIFCPDQGILSRIREARSSLAVRSNRGLATTYTELG